MAQDSSFDEAFQIYFKAGMVGQVGFGEKAAILVVDMTNGFTRPDYQLGADLSEVINHITLLLKKARKKKTPIFFTLCEYRQDMKDAGIWGEKLPSAKNLQIGSDQVEIDSRLDPQPGELIIRKKFPSCFFGTPLISYLITNRVDTLIVTGTTTSGCVRATVVDAMQYGFRTIVPKECVGDRAQAPHEANLFDMGMKYADVVPLQEVLDYLN
jgi:nicotinamidase-related amidase